MKQLPPSAAVYHRTPEYDEQSLPAGLRRRHTTKPGVWGRIRILSGSVVYRILEPAREEHLLTPGLPGIVEPQVPHQLVVRGPVRLRVEFLRQEPRHS